MRNAPYGRTRDELPVPVPGAFPAPDPLRHRAHPPGPPRAPAEDPPDRGRPGPPAGVPGAHTDTGPAERGPYRRHGGRSGQAVRVPVRLLSVHRAQITNREIAIETSAHSGV
ncbi:hypothetical protein Slala05_04150 [Streptomyces lavendulae subsp. lavendulae]|nr:hypothetical protein Slala05_04150 [Streptomyces lavendulae subsp. lavendulae]